MATDTLETKARRILSIYDRLHTRGARIQLSTFAEEIGRKRDAKKTLRALQRDFVLLKEILGTALKREQDSDERWYYFLEPRRLSEKAAAEQVLSVIIGAEVARFLPGPAFAEGSRSVVDLLTEQLNPGERDKLRGWRRRVVVIAPGQKDYRERRDLQATLSKLLTAMRRQVRLSLAYSSIERSKLKKPARQIEVNVLGLVVYRDGLYFIVDVVEGDADVHGQRRLLALDRMRDVAIVSPERQFAVPKSFDAREFFGDAFGIWRQPPAVNVAFYIDAELAPYMEERWLHRSQEFHQQQKDGRLLVRLRIEGMSEFSDWLLSLGEHVEVVEPEELRDTLRSRLKAALKHYVDTGGDTDCRPLGAGSAQRRRRP